MNITTKQFQLLTDANLVWDFLSDIYDRETGSGVAAPFFEYALQSSWMDQSYSFLDRLWLDGRRKHSEPEIFILLDEEYRNHGYGTQCVKELLRIAMEDYALTSVHGGCAKENIASARAMEKGGLVQYGTEENGDPLFRFTAKEKSER